MKGYIRYYQLTDWWKSEFSSEERAYITSRCPLVDDDADNMAHPTEIIFDTSRTLIGFLCDLSSWFLTKKDSHIVKRIIRKAEAMIDDATDIIDIHFLYIHKIQIYYKTRDLDSESLATAIDACNAQIAIAPEVAEIFKSEGRMPSHTGFSQLAIIMEKEKRYAEAIEISKEAISQGWTGDWEKRISRCQTKLSKS